MAPKGLRCTRGGAPKRSRESAGTDGTAATTTAASSSTSSTRSSIQRGVGHGGENVEADDDVAGSDGSDEDFRAQGGFTVQISAMTDSSSSSDEDGEEFRRHMADGEEDEEYVAEEVSDDDDDGHCPMVPPPHLGGNSRGASFSSSAAASSSSMVSFEGDFGASMGIAAAGGDAGDSDGSENEDDNGGGSSDESSASSSESESESDAGEEGPDSEGDDEPAPATGMDVDTILNIFFHQLIAEEAAEGSDDEEDEDADADASPSSSSPQTSAAFWEALCADTRATLLRVTAPSSLAASPQQQDGCDNYDDAFQSIEKYFGDSAVADPLPLLHRLAAVLFRLIDRLATVSDMCCKHKRGVGARGLAYLMAMGRCTVGAVLDHMRRRAVAAVEDGGGSDDAALMATLLNTEFSVNDAIACSQGRSAVNIAPLSSASAAGNTACVAAVPPVAATATGVTPNALLRRTPLMRAIEGVKPLSTLEAYFEGRAGRRRRRARAVGRRSYMLGSLSMAPAMIVAVLLSHGADPDLPCGDSIIDLRRSGVLGTCQRSSRRGGGGGRGGNKSSKRSEGTGTAASDGTAAELSDLGGGGVVVSPTTPTAATEGATSGVSALTMEAIDEDNYGDSDPDPSSLFRDFGTPLMHAIARGAEAAAVLLIRHGATMDMSTVEVRRRRGAPSSASFAPTPHPRPIAVLSKANAKELAKTRHNWFVKYGAPAHYHFQRPLQLAAENQLFAVCECLLNNGCLVDFDFSEQYSREQKQNACIARLSSSSSSPTPVFSFLRYGQTPLVASFWHNDVEPLTKERSGAGAGGDEDDADAIAPSGGEASLPSPSSSSSSSSSIAILKSVTELLLSEGADPLYEGAWLFPPLHAAASRGWVAATCLILKWLQIHDNSSSGGSDAQGALVVDDDSHRQPADAAVQPLSDQTHHHQLSRCAVDDRLNTCSKTLPSLDLVGRTPLVLAAMGGSPVIVSLLLQCGADRSVPCEGMLAVEWAKAFGNNECAELLSAL